MNLRMVALICNGLRTQEALASRSSTFQHLGHRCRLGFLGAEGGMRALIQVYALYAPDMLHICSPYCLHDITLS